MPYAIGIDLGGTNIKMVAVRPDGTLLAQETDSTEDMKSTEETREGWSKRIHASLQRLEDRQGSPARWVGLAAPGLAHPSGRHISWMQGRLDAVQGLDWTEFLGSTELVPVLNDAHAALLGEAWKGAAAGHRDVALLTLGTGVGGGALVDGRLLKGHIGRGGHLGHTSLNPDGAKDITGTPGSLEDAIGDWTVSQRTHGRFASTADLVKAAEDGDPDAREAWLRSVKALAAALVSIINVLDPEIVILGGGIANSGAALFDPLRRHLDEWEWRPTGGSVRIVPAALGEWAGAYGAAYHALNVNGEVSL